MFIAVLIYVFCIFLNIVMAKNKNRSIIGWLLSGIIFSGLSTIILLVLPKIKD